MLDVRTPIVPLWPTDDSQNQFIYYISGGYILIYFLILFIASVSRRKESCVVVIPPNESFQDEHLLHKYLLKVKTSTSHGSSCHALARVYIQLVGKEGSSPYYPVDVFYSGRFLFQRGCTDIFLFKVVDYLGEIDVVNFLIVNSKRSSWRPGDMMVMHVMSGNRWDVCYRVIDTDSGDEREGTAKGLTERSAVGQCLQWILKYHTWLSSLSTPIRYGAYTTRIHVLYLFWSLSIDALVILVVFCVTPQNANYELLYAIFQSCVATCFVSLLLSIVKYFLFEVRSGSRNFRKMKDFKYSTKKEIMESKEVLNINISKEASRQSLCQGSGSASKSSVAVKNVSLDRFIDNFKSATDEIAEKFKSAISLSKSTFSKTTTSNGFENYSFYSMHDSVENGASSTLFHDVESFSRNDVSVSVKTLPSHGEVLLNKVSVTWKSQSKLGEYNTKSVDILKMASADMEIREYAQNLILYARKAFQRGIENVLKRNYLESVNLIQRCIEIMFSNIENRISCLKFDQENLKDEEKFVNQGQERRVILNLIKLVLDRAAAPSPLSKGATLMICQELIQYFSVLANVEPYEAVLGKLQHPVEHMDKLLEYSVFKVLQSACETIYQTPVCLHTCKTESSDGIYSLTSVMQTVVEGDIVEDHFVYSLCNDIIERTEMEVTLEHQYAENMYLEFTIKQAILNKLRSICHSAVLLPDDEENLKEIRSRLHRKWCREGFQPRLDNRAQLAEVLLLQYARSLSDAGLLKFSDILQNETDFCFLQHMLERILAVEVHNNLVIDALSFVSLHGHQQDFESDIEVQMNKAMESLMGSRVLVTLTSRVVYEELLQCNAKSLACNVLQELEHDEKLRRAVQVPQLLCQEKLELDSELQKSIQENTSNGKDSEGLTDNEIQHLRKDLVPIKCFLRYVEGKVERFQRDLTPTFITKRWKFHKEFTTQTYETLTEAALMLDEDSVDKSLTPKLLYQLEWDVNGENRKCLPSFWMSVFAAFLFLTTVFSIVYVALAGAQLTVSQVTEWFACLLVSLTLHGLVLEVVFSIFFGKIQKHHNR